MGPLFLVRLNIIIAKDLQSRAAIVIVKEYEPADIENDRH